MFRLLLCCLVILRVLTRSQGLENCTCAAMDTPDYLEGRTVPIIEKSFEVLKSCKDDTICNDLCRQLAETTKHNPDSANEFCKSLKRDIRNVHVSVFSRICNKEYKSTGLTYEDPTCCINGTRVDCKTL